MSLGEYEYEPIRGLPGRLPPGEVLLWQGSPSWRALARRALHIVPVAGYFVLLAVWRAVTVFAARHAWLPAARGAGWLLLLGAVTASVLVLIAWLSARATVYSITNRRVVIRHGIALPMSMNIPLRLVEAVAISAHDDGTGELALALPRGERVAYALNWPHVRPGRYARPQPTLRAIHDCRRVGELLKSALLAGSIVPMKPQPPVEEHAAPQPVAA